MKYFKRIVIGILVLITGAAFLLWQLDYNSNKIKVSVLDTNGYHSEEFVGDKVNINTATAETLALIDGIGDKTADSIIQYRNEHGGFRNIEQIQNVTGIGPKIFEKIEGYICIGDKTDG